jgi:hypothetical protein
LNLVMLTFLSCTRQGLHGNLNQRVHID